MSRYGMTVLGVVVGVALVWLVGGAGLVPAAADDPVGAPGEASIAPPPGGFAPFEVPAGTEYRLENPGVERFKASLAPLWTWDGEIGTYGDGQTRIRLQVSGGQVAGVDILHNAAGIQDACLTAQVMYGTTVDAAGVEAACAGMWTAEWAEQRGASVTSP